MNYTRGFAQACLQLGRQGGELGLVVNFAGRRGHSNKFPWGIYKRNSWSKSFASFEEVEQFLEGYKTKLEEGR